MHGFAGLKQANSDFQSMMVSPQYGKQQKDISDEQRRAWRLRHNPRLPKANSQSGGRKPALASVPTGQGAPGAMNAITAAAAYRWNGLVDAFAGGNPALKVDENNVAGTFTQEKLQAMSEFARAHGDV